MSKQRKGLACLQRVQITGQRLGHLDAVTANDIEKLVRSREACCFMYTVGVGHRLGCNRFEQRARRLRLATWHRERKPSWLLWTPCKAFTHL
jgi:hypothetical protein